MNTNNTLNINTHETDGDEILMAFADAGSGADLSEWATRHPAHARDLARFAADRWSETATPVALSLAELRAVARLQAVGRGVVGQCQNEAAPLTSLMAAARERGLEFSALAARCEIPFAVLVKLHRRLIAPASVPAALVQRLADAVGRGADEVAAYLRQPPTLALGASYRADDAPQVGEPETFADALAADAETTDAQKARWRGDDGGAH